MRVSHMSCPTGAFLPLAVREVLPGERDARHERRLLAFMFSPGLCGQPNSVYQ
jgi:hypothetical protein